LLHWLLFRISTSARRLLIFLKDVAFGRCQRLSLAPLPRTLHM
jgi:hypothetical protein